MTIHPGNVSIFTDLFRELTQLFPNCIVNPYHVQGGYSGTDSTFPAGSLEDFESLNTWLVEQTKKGNPNISKRLHYYRFMQSIFDTLRDEPEVLLQWIFGHDAWQCFTSPGSMRYVQLGASPLPWAEDKKHPGGHRGCFWNKDTVTEPAQIGTNSDLLDYITVAVPKLVATANPQMKCRGCIMPRLIFDLLCLMAGMNKRLLPRFLELRQQDVGF